MDGGGCGRGGQVSDLSKGGCPLKFLLLILFLSEGGCSWRLLHVRSNDRVAQALHGEAGEGEC